MKLLAIGLYRYVYNSKKKQISIREEKFIKRTM